MVMLCLCIIGIIIVFHIRYALVLFTRTYSMVVHSLKELLMEGLNLQKNSKLFLMSLLLINS